MMGAALIIRTEIEVGGKYRFDYPEQFTSLEPYSQHRGAVVTVRGELPETEYDYEGERMFAIRAPDGWEGCAFESELVTP